MLSMENSQNRPQNKFIIKIASYLGLVEKYLELVLVSEQSYQFDLNPIFISNFFASYTVTQLHPSTPMGFTLNTFKYEKTYRINRK